MNVLGIDGGASSTKYAVLAEDGTVMEERRSGPLSGHVFSEEERAEARKALEQITPLKPHEPYILGAIVAGITGLDSNTRQAGWFAAELARLSKLPPRRIQVFNDMDLAYRANFVPGKGILVYAGTGSVAYHIAEDGSIIRAGGHGYLIGDEGGGFWIGKTALRQLLRWQDSGLDVRNRPLAQHLYRAIAGSGWPEIREYVYGGGKRAVAALAPAVGGAAFDGDDAAREILARAGRELAELAFTLRNRLGDLPVMLTGGALKVSPLIEQAAKERVELGVSHAPFAEAAARMALRNLHGS